MVVSKRGGKAISNVTTIKENLIKFSNNNGYCLWCGLDFKYLCNLFLKVVTPILTMTLEEKQIPDVNDPSE